MGGMLGLVLAGGTIWLALRDWPARSAADWSAAFAVWMLGWLFGPVLSGGGDETLRPEYFTLLPSRRAGWPPGCSLGVRRRRPGRSAWWPSPRLIVVASPGRRCCCPARGAGGLPPTAVRCARLSVRHARSARLMRAQIGAVGRGDRGGILALAQPGWVLGPSIQYALTAGFPENVSGWVRGLPSGWGLVAVEAAGRGDWLRPCRACRTRGTQRAGCSVGPRCWSAGKATGDQAGRCVAAPPRS